MTSGGALPGAPGWHDAVSMDTSGSDLSSRGYGAVLWEPDEQTVHDARITRFMRWLAGRGHQFAGYDDLWRWSVTQPAEFWSAVWDYFEVLGDRGPGPVLTGQAMPDMRWFTGATLNYARNALRTAWTDPDRTAIIFDSERSRAGRLTYAELAQQVARVARGLRALGVGRGDRVVALLPNVPEAVIGLLASASLGAIWSSCSPDFGARSVIDRFAQIEPKVLIACDGYGYNGRAFSRAQMVDEVVAALMLPGLSAVVLVDVLSRGDDPPRPPRSFFLGGPIPPDPPWEGRPAPPYPPGGAGSGLARPGRRSRSSASRSSRRCRSIIRSGWCTHPAPPGCPSRSCTGTAGSCSSISRRSVSTRTSGRVTCSPGTPPPAG